MTDNQKAFAQAEKELADKQIETIKKIVVSILCEIERQKDIKEKAEEALRILKLELEDLKNGRMEKIKERHANSETVRRISPIKGVDKADFAVQLHADGSYPTGMWNLSNTVTGNVGYINVNAIATSTTGTYNITTSSGAIKTYYL